MRTRKILAFTLLFSLLVASECFAAFPEIQFGRFYRDKDLQPIEWFILDETADSYLLLAKHCIDQQPFNVKRVNTSWETCTLRQWLNGEFLRTAFTQQEQQGLTVTLLTADEVVKYLPSASMRQCSPTAYARNRGVYINGRGDCACWTRSPGNSPIEAAYLSSAGDFGTRTHYVDDDVIGVRPAVWVKKSAVLYSIKPDSPRVYAAENTILPHVQQDKPYSVKELHDYFLADPYKALEEFDRKRLDVSGIVLRVGPDGVFGQPCVELSDKTDGKCYVLCIFQDTPKARAGDNISVRGNYLVTREDYGIVLKISEII